MDITSRTVDDLYVDVCRLLLDAPSVGNTREINNIKLTLTDIDNNIVSIRGISTSYLFGELLWYFAGRNETSFISKFSSFWENISDDGYKANSAYGHLMQRSFGFNQINKVIELLKKDPNSRRAKININTPNRNVIETKDEPCTMFLQFLIRDEKLHCTAVMRSNDIWLGFPYDVAFFTELQKYIADRLGIAYGEYTHFVVSMHLYERNVDAVKKIFDEPVSKPIVFDGKKLIENTYKLAKVVDIFDQDDAKHVLMLLLDYMDIYKEESA